MSLSFFLTVFGLVLGGCGICILIFALLFLQQIIEWPWPISLLDPQELSRFAQYLIYIALGSLFLGILAELAATYIP